jgi:hypothetical protein
MPVILSLAPWVLIMMAGSPAVNPKAADLTLPILSKPGMVESGQ